MRRVFIFDTSRCFGCQGCVGACIAAHAAAPELAWRTVHKLPPINGQSDTLYLSMACNHCRNAPCVKGCPAEALTQRAADGVVLHREERCIGCRYCQMVCPYDAIRWDAVKRTVAKCDFCSETLSAGEEPACVETCFAGALSQTIVASDDALKGLLLEAPGFRRFVQIDPSIRFVCERRGKR